MQNLDERREHLRDGVGQDDLVRLTRWQYWRKKLECRATRRPL